MSADTAEHAAEPHKSQLTRPRQAKRRSIHNRASSGEHVGNKRRVPSMPQAPHGALLRFGRYGPHPTRCPQGMVPVQAMSQSAERSQNRVCSPEAVSVPVDAASQGSRRSRHHKGILAGNTDLCASPGSMAHNCSRSWCKECPCLVEGRSGCAGSKTGYTAHSPSQSTRRSCTPCMCTSARRAHRTEPIGCR
jgi:hypothetical protein